MENLLHIVFDAAGAEVLKESFQLDDIIAGEVIVLEDDLAFGPLRSSDALSREQWCASLGDLPAEEAKPDSSKLDRIIETLREDANTEAWIWAAQNAKDVCGYYSLIAPLADFQGRVHIIYLNNLPFINEKGAIFYPTRLGQILPREFLKARKLAREITPSEFELDAEDWNRLQHENRMIRILEGGKKISSRDEDFFDEGLLQACTKNFQKAQRVIQQAINKGKHHQHELFLGQRLKDMVSRGMLEAKGELKTARDFEVRLPAGEETGTIEKETNDEAHTG